MYLYTGEGDTLQEVGYWRKANAINKWFTDQCNGGIEHNCQDIPVTKQQLISLKADVLNVLDKVYEPSEILPTQSGFFFGSTEYDDWYYDDLKNTVDIIDNALATGETDFTYSVWW